MIFKLIKPIIKFYSIVFKYRLDLLISFNSNKNSIINEINLLNIPILDFQIKT